MERIHAMKRKQPLYFHDDSKKSHFENLKWRSHMIQWFFEVLDHTEHDRSVAALAVNILDRYTNRKSVTGDVNQHDYSLAAITSLTIASKLYLTRHNSHCHVSVDCVVRLSQGRYSRIELEASELNLLQTIQWMVHPPIVPEFIEYLFHLLPRWENDRQLRMNAFEHARYASEIALISCIPLNEPGRMALVCILSGLETGSIPDSIQNAFDQNIFGVLGISVNSVAGEKEMLKTLVQAMTKNELNI
jgi:Cyclin, N-terminal domain